MCGRFLFDADFDEIYNKLSIYERDFVIGKRDFRPTDSVPVIVTEQGRNKMTAMDWGLKGYGSQNQLIINARSETLLQKQRYSNMIHNRCLIPATHFFEPETQGRKKIMHIFGTGDILFFTGLYEKVQEKSYVTLITMDSSHDVKRYHPRMPLALAEKDIPSWLQGPNESAYKIILEQHPIYQLMDETIQLSFF